MFRVVDSHSLAFSPTMPVGGGQCGCSTITVYCFFVAPCPYEPVPNEIGKFRSIDNPSEIQTCTQGMAFQDPPCDCVQVGKSRCYNDYNL